MQERYGIDIDAPGADPAVVAAALRDAERDRADAERRQAGEELTASQILFANADRYDREAKEWADRDWNSDDFDGADIADLTEFGNRDNDRKHAAEATGQARLERGSGELAYDSTERRQQFAASLQSKADQKTIDARILADGDQAKHPREAVMSQPAKAARPRRNGKSVVQQRERSGLARSSSQRWL